MKYVTAGGARMSAIGLGAWQFGSREWGYGAGYADADADAIVQRALDLGITLIDTAEFYAFGASERIVGAAIAERRADAFVATKITPVAPLAPIVEWRGRQSRDRLGVDTIDLYQLHFPNPLIPIGWQTDGLRRLQDQGVIRHAGVSNYSLGQWQAAERTLGGPVVTNQVQFSLVHPGAADTLVPWAAANDRAVIAYSPLGQGLLGARYDATNPPSGSVRKMNPLFLPENLERATPLLDALREIASDHDATPAQIALAWLIHHPQVIAIPGASSIAQVESNAAAAEIDLDDEEFDRLTKLAAGFRPQTGGRSALELVTRALPFT